jgi:hypothetical protein
MLHTIESAVTLSWRIAEMLGEDPANLHPKEIAALIDLVRINGAVDTLRFYRTLPPSLVCRIEAF